MPIIFYKSEVYVKKEFLTKKYICAFNAKVITRNKIFSSLEIKHESL